MLETIITSKTRIKLLTKFFLNPHSKAYLRELEESFGESSNAVRLELNRFEKAGLLYSKMERNRKIYSANVSHPLFPDINNILRKHFGIEHIINEIIKKIGHVDQVWLGGEFAKGNDSVTIELLVVGIDFDENYLEQLRVKATIIINRNIILKKITPSTFTEMKSTIKSDEILLLWDSNNPNS